MVRKLKITKEITLDVSRLNRFQSIIAKQNDKDSRYLKVSVAEEGNVLIIPSSAKVTITATRPDKLSSSFLGEVNEEGKAIVPLSPWMLELDGSLSCEVSIITEESVLTTTSFNVDVEPNESSGNSDVTQDPNYDILVELIQKVAGVAALEKEAVSTAVDAYLHEKNIRPLQRGTDYWTPEDKTEIINDVKDGIPFVKTAEQPTFVDSIDEMIDTSKAYVLSTDGCFYRYRKIENYNLLKLSEVSCKSRLQNDTEGEGIVSSNSDNAVTGWIPVLHGKYYSFTALFNGERVHYISNGGGSFPSIIRLYLKRADGTIIVYNKDSNEINELKEFIYANKAFAIPFSDVIEIRIHFNLVAGGSGLAESIETVSSVKPMLIEGDTASEAYSKSQTLDYIDGDAETIVEWYNTGLRYNQPASYEERVVKLEASVTELENETEAIKNNIANPTTASPYYRKVNWGCVPNEYFRGKCDSYSTEGFTNNTQYADYIAKFKALLTGHEAYVTETDLGAASDGQKIYLYDFKPVRWSNEATNIPKIIIIAGQHGWEKCNVFGIYYFVKDLLNNWFGSLSLEYLRYHIELMIVPVVNTYGFDNFQYKNANGVNINRNYSSNWTLLEDTESQQYGGAAPFDQPESQIIRDLVMNNKDCVLLIDSHTNSTTNTESWDKLGYYGFNNRSDSYFNRIREAIPELVSKISPNFNIDYNLNAPNAHFGFLTTSEGNGILRTWACDNNILGVLIEGFAGFLEGEPVSADVFKANEEQMVNWLITAVNYLSK